MEDMKMSISDVWQGAQTNTLQLHYTAAVQNRREALLWRKSHPV
jgi:hypothetical protein